MNISFFAVTTIYISFLLYVHYKLKQLEENDTSIINTSINRKTTLDTIISLDDIDAVDEDTFKDLEKFLATADIKEGFNFDVGETLPKTTENYYNYDKSCDIQKEKEEFKNFVENKVEESVNNIEAFDVFGASNFAPL